MICFEYMESYSLYLHIPFCIRRCSYCDFNTYAGKLDRLPAYVAHLCHELEQVGTSAGEKVAVHTIYMGGGTPSLLKIEDHREILDTIRQVYQVPPQAEISLEANPGTVTRNYLQDLVKVGYNRISFGMQAADPLLLTLLGRIHSVEDVIEAVKWAKQAGFKSVNLDLIFGLPGQTLVQWKSTLEFALSLGVEHLSLYALTVEEHTPIERWIKRGLVQPPDDDLAADMYEWADERLEEAGFVHYEISNWAKATSKGVTNECRHNLQYWRNQPYLGFGSGAHGFSQDIQPLRSNQIPSNNGGENTGARIENVSGIEAYLERMAEKAPDSRVVFPFSQANQQVTYLSLKDEMQETLMVGLRLTQEGVTARRFMARFERSLEDIFGSQIDQLLRKGLLEWYGKNHEGIRLTRRGRLLGNQVFMEFVGD